MGQSILIAPAAILLGLAAVMFFERPKHAGFGGTPVMAAPAE
jgi:hypothetical protein